jgi:hypothetical protein
LKPDYGKLRPSIAEQARAAEDEALQGERSRINAQLAAMQLPASGNVIAPRAAPAVAASTAGASARSIPTAPVANLQPLGESAMVQHAVCPAQIGDIPLDASPKNAHDKTEVPADGNFTPQGLLLPNVSRIKSGEKAVIPHPFIS